MRTYPPPLAGIHIVSLAQNVPGPAAVARLVESGARATKIEPPAGDPLRSMAPRWYRELHRGVRVLTVDLKSPAGAARLRRLLSRADLLLTSQRPSALHRLGLEADATRERFPQLRWVAAVGELKEPELAGHDLTYQAEAGLIDRDLPPTLFADLFGAERIVSTALLLLRTPPPAFATVGLRDSLDALLAPRQYGLTADGGPLGGGLPTYAVYAAKKGHVALAALESRFRARLYEALGLRDGSRLEEVMRTRTAAQWQRWARARDVPLIEVRRRRR